MSDPSPMLPRRVDELRGQEPVLSGAPPAEVWSSWLEELARVHPLAGPTHRWTRLPQEIQRAARREPVQALREAAKVLPLTLVEELRGRNPNEPRPPSLRDD